MALLDKLNVYQRQEASLKWEGTFLDYLEMVKERPHIAQHAHARIYRMIRDAGVEVSGERRIYKFFSEELFGLEGPSKPWWKNTFNPRRSGWTSASGCCS